MIHVKPEIVHFDGFEINEKHAKKLIILNASANVLRMHIIPPQSKYFSIKYKKGDRMVPGLTIECTIEFLPDEWRYYYDCIRINCPGDDNLIVPIHGYPIMSTKEFPRNFTFPVTPVGERASEVFPLRCMAPIDFEFEFVHVQPNPAFFIHPMSGIVPANSEVEVTVTFAPFEFQTSSMSVQLNISQFNAKPIICKFVGTSRPGLLTDKTMTQLATEGTQMLDPHCLSPLDRARQNRKLRIRVKKAPHPPHSKSIEYKGLKFPDPLDTPYHVAQVLIQEPGKLKIKELKDTILGKQETTEASTRQIKEARFDKAVRDNVYEERQNQLRWQVKAGDELISNKDRSLILDARAQAYAHYKYTEREDPVPEEEYGRQQTSVSFRRTIRDVTKLGENGMMFDPYMNDVWATRNSALDHFILAARKVIIRGRAEHKLKSLRNLVLKWAERKPPVGDDEEDEDGSMRKENSQDKETVLTDLRITADRIQRMGFPTYVPPHIKDDMAADALGEVPFVPTQVEVKEKVPYFNLKVPQTYRLQGYEPHKIYEASCGYVPPRLAKSLRSGAEDEIINLSGITTNAAPAAFSVKDSIGAPHPGTERRMASFAEMIQVEEKERESPPPGVLALTSQPITVLRPPEALIRPIVYPPLHIMNSAPGLQVFQAPMPYAETDPDFHLCPLPRYFRQDYDINPHSATQRHYLDREDTIRGIMGWKKFPSQSLTSLTNTPTLTNVWVPRWDDIFNTDLMPTSVPLLFDGLPAHEAENLVEVSQWDDEGAWMVNLTPEMVNSQFTLIDANSTNSSEDPKLSRDNFPHGNKMPNTNIPVGPSGPVPREKREEELEYFMTKKYNRLGHKVSQKVATLNNMLIQPNLQLK